MMTIRDTRFALPVVELGVRVSLHAKRGHSKRGEEGVFLLGGE